MVKILIVEDASIVALDLQRSLQNMGYQVTDIVTSGEAAVKCLECEKPGLILMDIKLSGVLDGIATAEIIRRNQDIPVIYLTAYSDRDTLERAKITEPFGYIIKPFEDRELRTVIEMALYKHGLNRRLKENEKWLATTLQSIGDAVIATDQLGRVIFLNPIAQKLTGWDQQDAYRQPLPKVFNIISEATGESLKNPVQKVLEQGNVVGLANHTLLIRRDGVQIAIDDSAAPIKNEEGEIIGVVLVFRDISDRRQSEKALEESEERYRAVMEQTAEGIYLLDYSTKRIMEANRSFAALLGYQTSEIIGRSIYELVAHSEDSIDRRIADIIAGQKPIIEARKYRRRDGTIMELQVAAGLIRYGGRAVLCSVVHDMSERKLAEEALRQSEARFRMLVDAIPDLMLRVDASGLVLDYKPASGLNHSPVLTVHVVGNNFYATLPMELRTDFRLLIDRALQGREIQNYEYQLQLKEGPKECEARVIPVAQHEVLIMIRDITERKQMERQLEYLSLHDALTGIYNRTYFEEEIRRLETMRQVQIGIIICDLDGLKLANDTLGHKRGDALLIAAAEVIKNSIRPGDLPARIGGDEFAVLIGENNPKIVENICGRIREHVQKYNDAHPELPLNMSFGFAVNHSSQTNIGSIFKEADDNMYREKLYRSQSTRSTIVQAMMKVLEVKDFITEGHANRLYALVVRLAAAINLPEPAVTNLRLLAQFHDIGKVGIPDRVLFKEGSLNREETVEIQRHAEIGNRIAKSIPELEPIADWILKHHEWWDGSGYPLGLKGEEIPLESRILAIADAYDAMTSDRPYRKALSHQKAIMEIQRCAGKQFDPHLAKVFIKILERNNSRQALLEKSVSGSDPNP